MIIATFVSCTYYDAFPPTLVSYFPYTENQQLVFTNERNDTTVLTVLEVHVSEKRCYLRGAKCRYVGMWFYAQNDTMTCRGETALTFSNGIQMTLGTCGIPYDREYYGDPYSSQMAAQIGDTVHFTHGNYEAIVVRYEGLVKFDDAKHECVWTLVK